MKKIKSFLLVAVALAALTLTAAAQSGFDLYGGTRTLVIQSPATKTNSGTAIISAALSTNGPFDLSRYQGKGILELTVVSNYTSTTAGVAAALTVTLEQSDDQSTWSAISTLAFSKSTTLSSTNFLISSNAAAANVYMWPGTNTTPTASTAGFYGDYTIPANYTASGAITASAGGLWHFGVDLDSLKRYIHIVYSLDGSNCQYSVGCTLTGRMGQ